MMLAAIHANSSYDSTEGVQARQERVAGIESSYREYELFEYGGETVDESEGFSEDELESNPFIRPAVEAARNRR